MYHLHFPTMGHGAALPVNHEHDDDVAGHAHMPLGLAPWYPIDDEMNDHNCTGVHFPASPSCFEGIEHPYLFVERCDELEDVTGYDTDEAAAKAIGLKGNWVKCSHGGEHYAIRNEPIRPVPSTRRRH